jgi:hypothetical protein
MNLRLLKMSALAFVSIASWNAVCPEPAAAAGLAPPPFNFNGIGNNNGNSTIQSYMAGVLTSTSGYTKANSSKSLVTVTGAISQQGGSSYTGDNHVTGPKVSGTVYPQTLGDTDDTTGTLVATKTTKVIGQTVATLSGSTDGYIKNCTPIDSTSACSSSSPDIFIDFSNVKYQGKAVEIASISFDFEIFPDGTCTKLNTAVNQTTCGMATKDNLNPNKPDLELWAGDGGTTPYFQTWYGAAPSGGNSDSNAMLNGETAPQLLGNSGTINVASNIHITSLDFMDWPETIGIDNLVITFRKVPEPASIGLFLLGLVGLGVYVRRKRAYNTMDITQA